MEKPEDGKPAGDRPDAELERLLRSAAGKLALFDTEGYEAAVADFREALERAPDCARARAGLAEAYAYWAFRREISGEEFASFYELAYEEAERALALAPRAAFARRAAALAARRGPHASAERWRAEARLAVRLDPADARNWYELWRASGYRSDDPALTRALELDPVLCGARIDLGAVLSEEGDQDGALRQLREALKINPRNALAWYDLAMVLERRGEDAKAREVLRKAHCIQPDDPLVESALADLEQGR